MNETLDRIMGILALPEDLQPMVRKALELAYKEGQLAESERHISALSAKLSAKADKS